MIEHIACNNSTLSSQHKDRVSHSTSLYFAHVIHPLSLFRYNLIWIVERMLALNNWSIIRSNCPIDYMLIHQMHIERLIYSVSYTKPIIRSKLLNVIIVIRSMGRNRYTIPEPYAHSRWNGLNGFSKYHLSDV